MGMGGLSWIMKILRGFCDDLPAAVNAPRSYCMDAFDSNAAAAA